MPYRSAANCMMTGTDEVDLIEVMFRAEERFGLVLPDNRIGPIVHC